MKANDVYQIVTDKVIEALEKGAAPWRKPWNARQSAPANFVTKKAYRGMNAFLMQLTPFSCPFWVSYKQAQSLGGTVKKGEKGSIVVFWNWVERKNETTGKDEKIPFLRYYTVFNLEQCEGIEWEKPELPGDFNPIDEAEKVAAGFENSPRLRHSGASANYQPALDLVTMPEQGTFDTAQNYYATLFHELGHATGHESRLNRAGITEFDRFGSERYAKEELVAEMTSAFLCAEAGIENTLEQTAAYIQGWLRALRNDRKLVVTAAGAAQKAADLIIGRKFEAAES